MLNAVLARIDSFIYSLCAGRTHALIGISLLMSLPASNANATSVAADAARQAVTGKFTGRTLCPKPVAVELELKTGADGPGVLNLTGTLRAPTFTTGVAGQLHLADGLLLLQNTIAPVDPCAFHIGSTCFKAQAGSGGSSTVFDDMWNKHSKENAEKKRADEIARSTFNLAAARNAGGDGLQGTIRGVSFDCAEFVLQRSDGGSPRALPAIDGDLVLDAVAGIMSSPSLNNSPQARIYWLNLAAEQGDVIAVYELAQAYETGTGVIKDPAKALQGYTYAAQQGNAKAQLRLAQMYLNGEGGVAKDVAQSEHWAALAKATIVSAGNLCATPQFVAAYYDLFVRMSNDPNAFFVKAFGEVLTSTQVQEGRFQIERVAPQDVSAVTRPFTCQVFGRSVGARVTSTAVPTVYEHITSSGSVYYTDNSSDVQMSQAMASVGTAYAAAPVVQPISIEPLAAKRYRVTMAKLIVTEYVTKTVEIGLP